MVWYVSYIVTQTSTKVLERVQREATPPAPQTVWWACALAHPRVGPPPPVSAAVLQLAPLGWGFWGFSCPRVHQLLHYFLLPFAENK